jgi:hypothetical protein
MSMDLTDKYYNVLGELIDVSIRDRGISGKRLVKLIGRKISNAAWTFEEHWRSPDSFGDVYVSTRLSSVSLARQVRSLMQRRSPLEKAILRET